MISGEVHPDRQARVPLELWGSQGEAQRIGFVLDTGFDGDLTLPPGTLQGLATTPGIQFTGELVDGTEITVDTWNATVLWHDKPRSILIYELDAEPLLGMRFIWENRLTMEA